MTEVNQSEPLVAIESLTANVKFFAFADDNRMPIRKVSVDWRDGSIANENVTGFYKNSKPFCADGMVQMCEAAFGSDEISSGLTCDGNNNIHCPAELKTAFHPTGNNQESSVSDESPNCMDEDELEGLSATTFFGTPRFGNQLRACTTNPFEFEHPYTCDEASGDAITAITDLPSDIQTVVIDAITEYNFSVEPDDVIDWHGGYGVCWYKPRVQVVDNWGYCNGVCPEGEAGAYCYSQNIEGGGGDCTWNTIPGYTPYTEYKGDIIVIPLTDLLAP